MIRSARIIFCDEEHGIGVMSFPDLGDLTSEDFVAPKSAAEVRKAAKAAGWSYVKGRDYCEMCSEGMKENGDA